MGRLRIIYAIFFVFLMSLSIVSAQLPAPPSIPGVPPTLIKTGPNKCPTIQSVEILGPISASDKIRVKFTGYNDPDGDLPLFKAELYVNGLKIKQVSSNDPLIEIDHSINRGDNLGILGVANDGACDSNEESSTIIVQNSAPVVKLQADDPKKSGEVVTFIAAATDADGDVLYYSFDFGDKRWPAGPIPPTPPTPPPPPGSSAPAVTPKRTKGTPTIPSFPSLITTPRTSNSATHTYITSIDPSYYTATVYVTDGVDVTVEQVQVYIGTGTPPSKAGCNPVENLNIKLQNGIPFISWTNPSTYDKVFVCALNDIDETTDLSDDSVDFLSTCNAIDLPGYSTSYTDLFTSGKRFYKIGSQCGSVQVMTEKTLGVEHIPLQAGLNEISTPFKSSNEDISEVLSSLGTGKGIDNLIHACGFTDYIGKYSSVMHFDMETYVSSLKAPTEAVKEATSHYVPSIDCRYYVPGSSSLFDLSTMEVGKMYTIDMESPGVFIANGEVMTSKTIDFYESPVTLGQPNHREQWFGLTLPYEIEISSLPKALQNSLDYISAGNKIYSFEPKGPKDFDKLKPGVGYRVSVKQTIGFPFEHPIK